MVEGQEGVSWPQWLDLARAAEEHGYDGLFRSDHYLSERPGSRRGALDAWGTICGLAAVTTTLKLGTAVSPASFRHPSVLSKLAVTADHISGGRVDVGLGAGWYAAEHRAYGFDFGSPAERTAVLEEQAELISRSWNEGPFSFEGRYYEVTELDALPKPVRSGGPTLIIGGTGGPRSLAIAARWAGEYNTPSPTREELVERREAFLRAWQDAGRQEGQARFSILAPALVCTGREQLLARASAAAELTGIAGGAAAYLDAMGETAVAGTPEEAIAQLRELESLGVDRVLLEPADHADLEMVTLIGEEVLPHVRGQTAAPGAAA